MRFLFLTPRLHNNYYELLKELREHDHEVSVGVLYGLPTERYDVVRPEVLGYSRFFLAIKRFMHRRTSSQLKDVFELRYGFPPILALWRLMWRSRADVVVIKNIDSLFSLVSLLFSRLMKKKILVHLQIDKHRSQRKSGSVAFVDRWFKAKVITPLLGDPKYPNENGNLYYIPFSQAIDPDPVDRRGRTGPIRILCVAKFQKRKNQHLLIQALQGMEKGIAYELHLVGQRGEPGHLEYIRALIRDAGLDQVVSIQLDLPWEKMQEEYRWADLYVLPSASEPAAVSLLEAMSFGLPVICSDQNGTRCYIVEGENGMVFRSNDRNELHGMLSILLKDRARLCDMSERSYTLTREHYSPEVTYGQFMALL